MIRAGKSFAGSDARLTSAQLRRRQGASLLTCAGNATRLALLAVACAMSADSAARAASKPNIIVIVSDDQGWTGTSVQMDPSIPASKSDFYETPRLAQMAAQGMRFGNAYTTPNCSPSKLQLLTGRTGAQQGMTDVIDAAVLPNDAHFQVNHAGHALTPPAPLLILPEVTTIPEWLKQNNAGYKTALIRKDHVGSYPTLYGFDEYDFFLNGYAPPGEDPKLVFSTANRANAFMDQQVQQDNPFFMMVSPSLIHTPADYTTDAKNHFLAKPRGQRHSNVDTAAMTLDLDAMLGQILDKVDQLGIADNTYIIYTSDNGGSASPRNNEPLIAGKGTLWEGGVRVPYVVKGPGIAPGSYSGVPTSSTDLFATVSDLAGVTAPFEQKLESASLAPILHNGGTLPAGQTMQRAFGANGELYFHFPQYSDISTPMSAVRDGDYKLVKVYGENGAPDQVLLFNIAANPTESTNPNAAVNLASQMPEKTASLLNKLDAWLVGFDAATPFRDDEPAELLWNAGNVGDYPSLWRSTTRAHGLQRESWLVVPNNPTPTPLTNANIAKQVAISPVQPGLPQQAFRFDGNDRMERTFIRVSDPAANSPYDVDNSITLEFWLKVDNLNQNQLIFESGDGTAGISISIGDANGDGSFNDVRARVLGKNGESLVATTQLNQFDDPTKRFVQIAAVLSDDPSHRFLDLYVNGSLFSHVSGVSGIAGTLDWDGTDGAGLGRFAGAGTGGNGGAGARPFVGGFKGEIAQMRLDNYAVDPSTVASFYNSVLDPVAYRIQNVMGDVVVPAARPTNVSIGQAESNQLQIVQESHGLLARTQVVDAVVSAGSSSTSGGIPPGSLPKNDDYTSYLLHFDPIGNDSQVMKTVDGTIVFEREITGLLFNSTLLDQTDDLFGAIGNYGDVTHRGLTFQAGDFLTVSEDRHSLTFSLTVPGDDSFQFRVITAADLALPVDGDFNHDGIVDVADLQVWKTAFGVNNGADADGDGDSDGDDFLVWQRQLGQTSSHLTIAHAAVPEPQSLTLLIAALTALATRRRR